MFSITLINRKGYTIKRNFKTIAACKDFAKYYPLSVFFGWIYDINNDKMCYQNEYTNHWKKVDNDSFTPYWSY